MKGISFVMTVVSGGSSDVQSYNRILTPEIWLLMLKRDFSEAHESC